MDRRPCGQGQLRAIYAAAVNLDSDRATSRRFARYARCTYPREVDTEACPRCSCRCTRSPPRFVNVELRT